MSDGNRKFYVSGFSNQKGKYQITKIEFDGEVYDITMGKNGVTYIPSSPNKLIFRDNQGKPMSANQVFNALVGDK